MRQLKNYLQKKEKEIQQLKEDNTNESDINQKENLILKHNDQIDEKL